jgi:hypothetical protein
MQYKVIPFVASIDHKKGTSGHVAAQLQKLIDSNVAEGWNYVRLESVTTYVGPDAGCFGVGAKPGYSTSMQMVVFSK